MARKISFLLPLLLLLLGTICIGAEDATRLPVEDLKGLRGLGYTADEDTDALRDFDRAHPGETVAEVRSRYDPFDRLRAGARGEKVRAVQSRLRDLGLDLAADGVYGKKTREAVRRFQYAAGLLPTGAVDSETLAQMASEQAPPIAEASEDLTEIYVLNQNTMRFHKAACRWVLSIHDANLAYLHGDREAALAAGYVPCKVCRP